MYGLYLQSCPSKAAALIAHVEQGSREERTQSQIMSDMRQEWKWILQVEESSQMNAILRKWCPFLAHYQVREIHSVLMEEKWSFSERSKQLLLSWFPKYSFSSNIEDLFNSLEDGLRRGVKNNKTSLSNMQCIAIRSLQHKLADGHSARTIELQSEDFEGNEIRAIKPRIWRPDSYAGSPLV